MQPSGQTNDSSARAGAEPAYSVVIPCYNSSGTIGELFNLLDETFNKMASSYEILAVDDASTDPLMWQTIVAAARGRPVRAFQLTRNFGRTAAVLCGFERAMGQWIIVMDDDLQHRPEVIPELAKMREHDAVIADFPYHERHHTFSQRMTSRLKNCLDGVILDKPRHIRMSPFIMIKTQIAKMMLGSNQRHPYFPALLFYVTRDIVSVHASHAPRKVGRSNLGFLARLKMFSNLIFNNSTILLRAVAAVGALLTAAAALAACYLVFAGMVSNQSIQGWTSVVVIELFVGGAILLSLGIMGEYLGRVIQLAEHRPAYFVRASLEATAEMDEAVAQVREAKHRQI
jgi:glycosyltransferase involved in cell wall biosynthesis